MGKSCEELLEGLGAAVAGECDGPIEGLAFRSDRVEPGFAFFCIVGLKADGHRFAQDAVDRGARLVVAQRELELENASGVAVAVVGDTRAAMASVAARYYGEPSAAFDLVGITGTNGKTTTTFVIDHIVSSAGRRCGIIGTTGNRVGDVMETAANTTPESVDLQHLFARMRDAGNDVVAMEVSSHALDLRRTWATRFAVTAFTNLTQDHLDYHHTFEAYFEAKAKLFGPDYPARRGVCIDDEWGAELARRCREAGDELLTTGFDPAADIHPVEVSYATDGTRVRLSVRGEELEVEYPLVGRFNVSNVMTAFAVALHLGIPAADIATALRDVPGVPGRLERISESGCPDVFVDYAHTPDAVEKALASVMALNPRRTIVVFGCGGDRDATKRPLMGKAALAADYAIVTSDNPRTEDPDAIIADIVAGMGDAPGRFEVVPDRRAAILRAIELADEESAVLVAGKGHEDYQIIGTTKIDFDDRKVVSAALQEKARRIVG